MYRASLPFSSPKIQLLSFRATRLFRRTLSPTMPLLELCHSAVAKSPMGCIRGREVS